MKVVLIGCGNMGSAIVRGAVGAGVLKSHDVICIDRNADKAANLARDLGAGGGTQISEPSSESTCFIIAVKPDAVVSVIAALPLKAADVVVSVAAGVSYGTLVSAARQVCQVVRTMPNTPSMVGQGATALYSEKTIPSAIRDIFEAIGLVVELEKESLFDAVTGLSGSGPAYIFVAIEALADGGVQMGLPREMAQMLAIQTILGAATLAQSSTAHPGQLKDNVSSPGGATIAALGVLEKGGFRSLLMEAVKASATRSEEMKK